MKKHGITRKFIHTRNNRGLTLVETLVAISILIVAVVMSLSVYADNIAKAQISRDRSIATYLAEEGIELVRMVAYSDMNKGNEPTISLNQCQNANGCQVADTHWEGVIMFKNCPGGGACDPLKMNTNVDSTSYGVYGHTPDAVDWKDTPFTRKILVSNNSGADDFEQTVTSTVTWDYRGTTQTVSLKTYLYNYLNN